MSKLEEDWNFYKSLFKPKSFMSFSAGGLDSAKLRAWMIKMSNVTRNLWPYSRRAAIIAVPIVLLALTVLMAIIPQWVGWPTEEAV